MKVAQQPNIINVIKLKHYFSQTLEFLLSFFKLQDALVVRYEKTRIHVDDVRITKHPVSNLSVSR